MKAQNTCESSINMHTFDTKEKIHFWINTVTQACRRKNTAFGDCFLKDNQQVITFKPPESTVNTTFGGILNGINDTTKNK